MHTPEKTIKELQKKTLSMLVALVDHLEAEEINYFLIGGGLIGAKRHGGFIPWDDDIDICIPRPDYERLIRSKKLFPPPYELRHWAIDPDHIYPYAKLYDTSTTIVEDFKTPFKRGLWIDIFPIDGTFKNLTLRRLHFWATEKIKYATNISTGAISTHSKAAKLNKLTAIQKLLPTKMLNKLLNKVATIKNYKKAAYAANLFGRWRLKESAPKELFEQGTKLQFETITIRTMLNHEKWLRNVYGDYMSPPPIHLQKPDHLALYVDLEKSFK